MYSRVRTLIREHSLPKTPAALMSRLWRRALVRPVLRYHGGAYLYELGALAGGRLYRDPASFLSSLRPIEDNPLLSTALEEFHRLWDDLMQRVERSDARYPPSWGLEEDAAAILYVMTRWTRPKTVVESGVADGRSTILFLQALRANGGGSLHSIDVRDNVGSLLGKEDRDTWHFHLLPWPAREGQLRTLLSSLPPPDLFFHDSDHSYRWQRVEYGLARERMEPGSLLVSDDVDASRAFLHFCRQDERCPSVLVGTKSVLGTLTL